MTHSGKVRAIFFIIDETGERNRSFIWALPDRPPATLTLPTFNHEQQPETGMLQLGELPCRLLYLEGEAVDRQVTAVYRCLCREEKVNV